MILRAALLASLLALGSAASAQADGGDLAGDWQIVPVDGAPVCAVTLGSAPAAGGWHAAAGAACRLSVPAAASTAAWNVEAGLQLIGPGGEVLMRFEEDETALLASPRVAAPAFYLIPAIPGFVRLRQPGGWAGDWEVTRKGHRPCVLRFSPPTPGEGPHPGGSVTPLRCGRAAPGLMRSWYLEGIDLILTGPGDRQIVFAPDGAETHRSTRNRWRLGPARARP